MGRPMNMSLAGKSQPAGFSAEPLTLQRGNRRQVLLAGYYFDAAGRAEAMSTTDVPVVDTAGE